MIRIVVFAGLIEFTAGSDARKRAALNANKLDVSAIQGRGHRTGGNDKGFCFKCAEEERQRVEEEMELPVCDVFRDGADKLRDAVLDYQQRREKP